MEKRQGQYFCVIKLLDHLLWLSVEWGTTEVWGQTFGLKITVLSRAAYRVSSGNNIDSRASHVVSPDSLRALLLMTSKADKSPLETELVDRNNNTIFTLKTGEHWFFVAPYSTPKGAWLATLSTLPNPPQHASPFTLILLFQVLANLALSCVRPKRPFIMKGRLGQQT